MILKSSILMGPAYEFYSYSDEICAGAVVNRIF